MMRSNSSTPGRRHHAGFSLVELMIAMVVGMGVVAALMASYFAVFQSNRQSKAMSQVTEDAAIALSVLRTHLSLVGYSRPVGAAPGGGAGYLRAYTGDTLAGCDGDFKAKNVAIAQLDCDSSATAASADAIAVAYEADVRNSLQSGGVPLDCLGNSYAQTTPTGTALYLAYHIFYIANSTVSGRKSLYCLGPGNATGQALVENVEDMQLLYGISPAPFNTASNNSAVANHYETSTQMAAGTFSDIATNTRMRGVVSVRICLLVSSEDEVLDQITPYRNCQQTEVTPTDKRIYRAFYSTVVLNNRLGAV